MQDLESQQEENRDSSLVAILEAKVSSSATCRSKHWSASADEDSMDRVGEMKSGMEMMRLWSNHHGRNKIKITSFKETKITRCMQPR